MTDTTMCEDCFQLTEIWLMFNDRTVCPDCGERYVPCEAYWCEHLTNNLQPINDTMMCETCVEQYDTCTDCERDVHCENIYTCDSCDDALLCAYCHDTDHDHDSRIIHDYSYKPYPIFHGRFDDHHDKQTKRFYGLELEIDGAGESSNNAEELLKWSHNEDLYYIKSDGSLHDGLEIVTHPATLDFHLKKMPWPAILDKARDLGYKSHQTATCGLHIHVSTAAFGKLSYDRYGFPERKTDTATSKLVALFWRLWPELTKFSRRTNSQIYEWCRPNYDASTLTRRDLYQSKYKGRYMALNFSGPDTIEVRLFRGSLRMETIGASLELIDLLVDLATTRGFGWISKVTWDTIISEAKGRKYLGEYLQTRNLRKEL